MDNLDDLLTPIVGVPENLSARNALRDQTAGVVRRRRWRKLARRTLALAACYVAGVGTYWLVQNSRPPVPVPSPQSSLVEIRPPTTTPKSGPIRIEPPDRTEHWAAQATTGERRVELYRKAGDGYLVQGDEIKALRCYRKSLDYSRPDDLVIQPEHDTWLLMSLKIARQREKIDARN
jgi:hypothetical protein